MARIEFDLSEHPLIVFRVPEFITPDDVDAHFARLREELFPLGRYASIMDARLTEPLGFDAQLRRHAAMRYQEHEAAFTALLVSECYVLQSSLQRGVLAAIRWLAPPPWPTKNFGDLDEARAWSLANIRGEAPAAGPPLHSDAP